jgi:hypothetical protein
MVNVADGVIVCSRFRSVTFIRKVYDPGAKVLSGSHFSIVTCETEPSIGRAREWGGYNFRGAGSHACSQLSSRLN